MEPAFASTTELAQRLRSRRIGCRELLELYLDRIDRYNPVLNAVVAMDVARARTAADEADRALARGTAAGPLHGLPMTVKESFDVAGLPTTWGAAALRGNIARSTAEAVRRLEAAGAIVFGKTNVPLMLADWQCANELYGVTVNPWDPARTPGGSSGGSAAALAAGLTGFEFGSDIGGSLRVPAHFCGVYSHKPTWGIVPVSGHGLSPGPATDVSVCGPMGRGAADLELGLRLSAGPEGADARGWSLRLPPCARARIADFRIAVLLDAPQAQVDAPVRRAIEGVARFLASEGAEVSFDARPAIDFEGVARDATLLIRGAQSAKLPDDEYERQRRRREASAAGDDGYEARYARAVAATHREWLAAHARRHAMQQAWEEFFARWDVLLCPPASTTAFAHDRDAPRHLRQVAVNGRLRPSIEQVFWAGLAGIAYLPATVAPAGRTEAGLPVGVQIVGPRHGDLTCIALARWLEAGYCGFEPPEGMA